jgi:uncharacterized protein (DUF433 family)
VTSGGPPMVTSGEGWLDLECGRVDTLDWRDYIQSDPGVLGGKPHLAGTRLAVEFVLELLAGGWDGEALRENYPSLTEERVRAVLAYAAETFREERFYRVPPAGRT